ncbi:hypothetical protein JD844_010314 [Phrynosoma platyrhinos]|uniref:Cyclin-Q n=1 Tax=Phrynosoma platyrhinos TaxID=52577 RepID=A0ABQ7TH96_PHRPL|nr:hypothetical protein JD844_010314 [Phrynosoma platyrhinos]
MDPTGLQEASSVSADARTHFKVCRFIMEAVVIIVCCLREPGLSSVKRNLDLVLPPCPGLAGGGGGDGWLRELEGFLLYLFNVNRYLHPRSDTLELDTHFWELRDSIVQCELLMLRMLCFRVSFQHPHKYLLHYLLSLKHWMNRHSWDRTPVAVAAWALLRDSYHGPLCLQHAPQHIAVTVLYLALQCYGVEVPAEAEAERPWWQVFSEDLSKSIIDQIVLDLIKIYTLDAEIA